ncbi:putative C-mannosyltransferase DPY19L1 [Liparis tanakae]|uniref:Putative C-mannosyltransferase DPY19L1 n=1 Tax=Liparis tanakae TaxID=230148 RepID=A0A4Z2EE42_9TELE|nr:putative C-mannosyltransferase DPY19L1 [Liparis tanakae]
MVPQLFGWIGERFKHQLAVYAVMAVMAVQGVANLRAQWGIIGEFSNMPQEELLDWIQDNTRPDSVFAGAMPTMASVKLSTGRPIVNHPHYEDAGLRSVGRRPRESRRVNDEPERRVEFLTSPHCFTS